MRTESTTDEQRDSVAVQRLVRLCRRHSPEGRDFKLIPQRVFWSGDTIDVCSACGMNIYDREWPKHHIGEPTEMVEPNITMRNGQEPSSDSTTTTDAPGS